MKHKELLTWKEYIVLERNYKKKMIKDWGDNYQHQISHIYSVIQQKHYSQRKMNYTKLVKGQMLMDKYNLIDNDFKHNKT